MRAWSGAIAAHRTSLVEAPACGRAASRFPHSLRGPVLETGYVIDVATAQNRHILLVCCIEILPSVLVDEVVKKRLRFRRVPFGGPRDVAHDSAVLVDDIGDRQAPDRQLAGRHLTDVEGPWALVGIEPDGEMGESVLVEEWHDRHSPSPIDCDGDNAKARRISGCRQPVERRHLISAGQAPACPEIEEDHSAAEPDEVNRPAVDSLEPPVGVGSTGRKKMNWLLLLRKMRDSVVPPLAAGIAARTSNAARTAAKLRIGAMSSFVP